jgi:signal transduction histidine kinase
MEDADYNLRILGPIAAYFADRPGGTKEFEAICARAKVAPADFEKRIHWVSWATMEAMFRDTREALRDDDEFWRACCHRMTKAYGAMLFLGWSVSPRLIYARSERGARTLTSAGKFEVVETTPRSARLRYTSKFKESRLFCISRQAQCAALPAMLGGAPATVREHACMARGDAHCEYEFVWLNRRVWTWPVLVGVVSTLLTWRFGAEIGGRALYLVPAFAALVAYSIERHRVSALNELTMIEISDTLRATMGTEADVRRELLALQDRNAHWARLVEQSRRERQAAIETAQEKLSELTADQQKAALGVSHDLNNPMSYILHGLDIIEMESLTDLQRETTQEMRSQTLKVLRLIAELMTILKDKTRVPLKPVRIASTWLADEIQKRTSSQVHEKDIRVTVFANRECPESIEIDRSAIDRILDNVISNAAKYTARGSILIELDGVRDELVLKIGDTGRGIDPTEIERIFRGTGSDEYQRAPNSYGVGLAGTVDLLGELGGKLEVMSKVGEGTTLWVYLPVRPPRETKAVDIGEKRREKRLLEIVRVRKHPA